MLSYLEIREELNCGGGGSVCVGGGGGVGGGSEVPG